MSDDISSAGNSKEITPSDTEVHKACRGIYVGVSGHLTYETTAGSTVTKRNVAAGVTHGWEAVRIFATGTTATDIVLDY